jgi:hypothetical protein
LDPLTTAPEKSEVSFLNTVMDAVGIKALCQVEQIGQFSRFGQFFIIKVDHLVLLLLYNMVFGGGGG